ncbi:isoleucine--tRNA ligase [Candidatus Microgenomates bacterium]|nr:MAG: isoleucine--tRNA ligase [Candidatus Microgenomates bacterium]
MAYMGKFNEVDPKASFPNLENKIIDYWKEHKVFEESVESRPRERTWTFLDGPPFITGMPHYGSLLSSMPKDLYPRFWTMKGFRVRRVWGWDCHGLPAENKVENKLGIKRKKDIEEKVGVKKFIDECKLYVSEVSSEWEWYVDHIGRWVDFKNAYRTMDKDYMESVMWVFSELYKKNLIYKGLRVSLYCPHCSTPISNFEVAMDADNYQEVKEPANTYKYKLKDAKNTYLLAWSTTPWNKIATPALAVNPKLKYVRVKQGGEFYILAKATLNALTDVDFKIVEEFPGSDLVGQKFEPHYNFYKIDKDKKAFVVIPGDFVSADEGTGVVTIAAYGEEDLQAMKENNIQIIQHIDEEGKLKSFVPKWGGMNYLDVNPLVNEDLSSRGLMYHEENHTHTIPTCWRCHTRLIFAPQDAWYVDIQKLKPKLKAQNSYINWFPGHFKNGRFEKSLDTAPDWCISRSRYWGSPVPVWECECGERFVPSSIKELEKKSQRELPDIHKPEIDGIQIKCDKCGKTARRVPEVLDSWIEAGSASFAERHYPFNEEAKLSDFFPPDFISEYTGQIRAWFYVLHVISVGLSLSAEEKYNIMAKNVLVTGVIKGTDGRKMSKNFGNYPDPKKLIEQYGGDALRLYLLGSPVMKGEDILVSEEEYRNQVKGFLLPLWNIYNYFVTYANAGNWELVAKAPVNTLDKWIVSRKNSVLLEVTRLLEEYDSPLAIEVLRKFIVDDVSGWYVRRSRNRQDKEDFYSFLHETLVGICKMTAPVTPFISEEIYRNLTKEKSVHLATWDVVNETQIDDKLEMEMASIRAIAQIAHSERKAKNIPVRQPLLKMTVSSREPSLGLVEILKEELNVRNIVFVPKEDGLSVELDTTSTPELLAEARARELIRQIQAERKRIGVSVSESVDVSLPEWPLSFEEHIKSRALIANLTKGDFKVEKRV